MGLSPDLKDAVGTIYGKLSTEQMKELQRVGVDASCWIQKACKNNNSKAQVTPPRVIHDFFAIQVQILNGFEVEPFLVFDGDYLPAAKMLAPERNPPIPLKKKNKYIQHRVDRTRFPDIIYDTVKRLEELKLKFKYIVAPNEADAQLRYLERKGEFDTVLTTDSDLIAYGCGRILFNLNLETLVCEQYHKASLLDYMSDLDESQILPTCLLAGCDYSNPVVSDTEAARKYMREHGDHREVIKFLSAERKDWKVIEDRCMLEFEIALFVFNYMRVYDIETHEIVHLNPLDMDGLRLGFSDDFDIGFLGNSFSDETDKAKIRQIASGIRYPHAPYNLLKKVLSGIEDKHNIARAIRQRKEAEKRAKCPTDSDTWKGAPSPPSPPPSTH